MKINPKWMLVFFTAAMALLFVLTSSASLRPDDYQCTGSIGAIQVANLVVPENATCTLNGTIVDGNIVVKTNAALQAGDVRVKNDIKADKATLVIINAGSTVGGNVQIVNSGTAEIQSADIKNNLTFNENHLSINASNNTIGSNLQANKNTGGVTINGNRIGGNLQCKENVPPPAGSGNIVNGNMEDQCAGFGVPPTPAPTNTPQVPTGTPPAATQTPGVDTQAPTVRWTAPVLAGERDNIRDGEQVLLVAEATDNGGIKQVRFFRWDAVNLKYITIGTLDQAPFQVNINASALNPAWNEVFVVATDMAGNRSDFPYIWLYKLAEGSANNQIFLPITGK